MPEVVFNYLTNNDLISISSIYQALITAYFDDVEKYAQTKKEATIIRFLIEKSFFETGKRIKLSGFGNSNYSGDDIKDCFLTLEKALITTLMYPTTKTELPIETNFKKSPKLLMLDIGLVNYFAGYQSEIIKSEDIGDVYHGLITEQVIAQELKAYADSHLKRLHFWVREKKQSNAEVDFVYQVDNLIIPIEVKTGKSGRLRSLHQFIDNCPHRYAVRIYSGKFEIQKTETISGKEFHLLNLPFYLISKLEEYIRLMID